MNDWGDVHCYFTLGKGMLHGMVPYRDYIEQKGIVIFALYALAVIISETSFIGVYIIEILSIMMFLVISLRIINLFFDSEKYSVIIVCLLAGVSCSSALFCHGGSPEEILLPSFVYGTYIGLKYFEKDDMPSKIEMFILGIFAGLIFFTKFTLCIFYISIILFMTIKAVLQRDESYTILFKNAVFFLIGCIVITIPVAVYFLRNNAINEFVYVYFYKNIFEYSAENTFTGFFKGLTHYVGYAKFFFRKRNVIVILLIFAGEFWLWAKKKHFIAWFQFITFIMFYFLEFVKMRPRKYYGLPLTVFMIFGICAIIDILIYKKITINLVAKVCFGVFMIIFAVVFTDNRYYMFKDKDSVPQYVFAKEMKSYGYNDYHLLYYGTLDQGYYFASGTLPNCRAFVQLNLQGDELKNIQDNHINERRCEFIITDLILCDSDQYENYVMIYGNKAVISPFDNFGYELVDEVDNFYEGESFKVRLYKLVS